MFPFEGISRKRKSCFALRRGEHYSGGMDLESMIANARANGASDLHLESGLPAALRIRGALRTIGDPIPGKALFEFARQLIGDEHWTWFLERRSYDLSKTI